MDEKHTPKWLIDTQNRSWEPEVLISGITLTFIFIISNNIYNFFGMLVQDFGVWFKLASMLYTISIIIITGLKFILILHLILRGIWTGLVGISYVFPSGVNKEKLPKMESYIDHAKPVEFVIKIEKVCSLLFSFIFLSVFISIGFYIIFIPVIILFVVGLDISHIRNIMIYVIVPAVIIASILYTLVVTRFKDSKAKQKMDSGPLNVLMLIYVTNLGIVKTFLMFAIYFILVTSLSVSDLQRFKFRNDKSVKSPALSSIINLNKEHYGNRRDQDARIVRSTIDRFRVNEESLELFISNYQEDKYTVRELGNGPEKYKELFIKSDSSEVSLKDLYTISIDSTLVTGLNFYQTANKYLDQKGIVTSIPMNGLSGGYHELKISKIYWSIKKKEMLRIENWDIIPFEIKKQ